jgi:hypothetical protein
VNTWRGENLVAGTEGADYAFQMWRDSEGHRANMLGANYTVIGIARSYSVSSDFGWYWATEFGGEAVGAPPPPEQVPAPPPAPAAEQPYVAPEPQPAAPAPQAVAPPPEAPTASPTAVPLPSHAPDGKAPWWHAVAAIGDEDLSGAFWADGMVKVAQAFHDTQAGNAVRVVH